MSHRWNRRGAALPLAIFTIALLTIGIAVAFSRMSSERRVHANQDAQLDAFAVAQSGLEQYLSGVTSMPPASLDTTISGLVGGSAAISVRQVRDTIGGRTAVYLISSRGVNSTATRYDASAPPAERIVAQYAVWRSGSMTVNAAFTSLSGVDKNGKSGSLNGNDACGAVGALPGVAVPNGLYSGKTEPIDGNPEDAPAYIGTAGPLGTAKDAVHIDWDGIVNGNALPADYTIPSDDWPNSAEMSAWPVIRVDGNYSLSGGSTDGKGILIVTGNLTINGSWHHEGIVLVGGTVTSNGNNTISGAIVTGLNVMLGDAVSQTSVGNGNKTFEYNSCDVAQALKSLSRLERVSNGWMDNWPNW